MPLRQEARDHCFRVCEERGIFPCLPTEGRAPPKRAPEMRVSCGYQLGHQRWACNTNATVATTKKPVCKHRSLYTAPTTTTTQGACAALHCQGHMIQVQLPWEKTRCTSGCCNVMPDSAAAGSPCIPIVTTIPLPRCGMSGPESPNQWLL